MSLLALPFLLGALTGPPSLDGLRGAIASPATSVPDPTAPVVAALALVAWACCGWLLLLTAVTAVQLDAVGRWLAPAAVRAVVRAAIGATALTVLAATPALAQAPVPPPPAETIDLDWPAVPSTTPAASPASSPASSPAAAPATRPVSPAATPSSTATTSATGVVVVQPGDSLWGIAARRLRPQASAREIAQAWPSWWAANRAAVGADPDLIFPGTALHDPTRGEP